MKTIFKNICLVLVFVIAGSLTGIAQISPEGAKGAKDLEKKKEEVKEVVTQDLKNDKEGMKAKKDQMKDEKREMKEKMKDQKRELKEEMKDAKGEMKDKMKEEKSELKDAKKEMKERIKEEKKGNAEGLQDGIDTGGAVDQQTVISATDGIEGSQAEAKKLKELKGKKLGQARASNAKKMIESREKQMANKDAFVIKSKAKIAGAKKSLAAQIASGSVSQEKLDAKQASIDKAERSLKAYEERVEVAKQKYSNQKSKVSELYKEN